ncbi:hypothetical protein C1646_775088 [Rhizophagus diaphanus]|nr:hypothetical protein C1646_775088 [Rhizophagus diaphanus] [Rhizophagus sp. MUCL 43196]
MPTTSTDQTRIIKIIEEYQRPTKYKVVTEFLQNKMEALNIDENDDKKFDKISADDISNMIDALNLLRTAEHKLKGLNLSFESAIKLVKDLESEQKIPAILEIYASDASSIKWSSIMRKFQGLANSERTEDACRSHWKKNYIDKKEGILNWLAK